MKSRKITTSIWLWFEFLKSKVVNFDIKPAKSLLSENIEKAVGCYELGDYANVEQILKKELTRHPNNLLVLQLLASLYAELNNFSQLIKILRFGIKRHPDNFDILYNLAILYTSLGMHKSSFKIYSKALELRPHDKRIQHMLAAAKGDNIEKADPEYIEGLFNWYAEGFEDSLLNKLEYKSHIRCAEGLEPHIGNKVLQKVVDLGCGTGLLGYELKQRFAVQELIGVDIAANMLAKCEEKALYDRLCKDDLVAYLQQTEENVDLIISSDSLVYLGDLEPIFAHAHRLLHKGGFLAFTIERSLFGTYKLTPSGRYQHSRNYINSLYKRYHFSKMYSQTIDLRKEYGNMVVGYLVLIQK